MTDFIIRADNVVYWGDTSRLLQEIARLLGISPDHVTIEIVPADTASQDENQACVWDTIPDGAFLTAGSPE